MQKYQEMLLVCELLTIWHRCVKSRQTTLNSILFADRDK